MLESTVTNCDSFRFVLFQMQELEITLNNIYYDVIDLKKLGLTNDKEVWEFLKYQMHGVI